jgi:hypothetical protein
MALTVVGWISNPSCSLVGRIFNPSLNLKKSDPPAFRDALIKGRKKAHEDQAMTRERPSIVLRHIRQLTRDREHATLQDRELLERFAVGHEETAFATLVRRHGRMVLGVCRRVLQQEQDAEDAFQATFLILARKAAAPFWQESVAGWLYRVASRVAVRARRQAARRRDRERRPPQTQVAEPSRM